MILSWLFFILMYDALKIQINVRSFGKESLEVVYQSVEEVRDKNRNMLTSDVHDRWKHRVSIMSFDHRYPIFSLIFWSKEKNRLPVVLTSTYCNAKFKLMKFKYHS